MRPRTTDKQLLSFSRVMAVALVIFGLVLVMRKKPEFAFAWTAAALFYVTGVTRPQWLALAYRAWMGLAYVLSWVNTRILLAILFYGILTPVALAMRLFRFDPLERHFDKRRLSYWQARQKRSFDRSEYERLY